MSKYTEALKMILNCLSCWMLFVSLLLFVMSCHDYVLVPVVVVVCLCFCLCFLLSLLLFAGTDAGRGGVVGSGGGGFCSD